MRFFLLLFLILGFANIGFGQNDLLVLKKNNRVIKSYYPDSEIKFISDGLPMEGYITSIARDTIFLIQYDVRQRYTNLGVYVLDTVARYRFSVAFGSISALIKERSSFLGASGAALLGGGVVLTTAGLLTWVLAKPDTRYYARPELVIGAATAALVGYAMIKLSGSNQLKLGKKYTLSYIRMN